VPLLLHALDGISDQFETWIVGDGELRTEHEALAKQLELKNVHFYGRRDGDDLKKSYQDADIFVLPSDREGMPLVLLEAMAMALPTVGTDVTGIRDFVADKRTGLLAPLGNAQAYRRALTDAVKNDTVYKKMSHAASEAAKQYSWPVVARKFEELYDN
jgi:glycosyltransferase involved in cell wall biosynthesis